jgi:hypothetical protein
MCSLDTFRDALLKCNPDCFIFQTREMLLQIFRSLQILLEPAAKVLSESGLPPKKSEDFWQNGSKVLAKKPAVTRGCPASTSLAGGVAPPSPLPSGSLGHLTRSCDD